MGDEFMAAARGKKTTGSGAGKKAAKAGAEAVRKIALPKAGSQKAPKAAGGKGRKLKTPKAAPKAKASKSKATGGRGGKGTANKKGGAGGGGKGGAAPKTNARLSAKRVKFVPLTKGAKQKIAMSDGSKKRNIFDIPVRRDSGRNRLAASRKAGAAANAEGRGGK